jgi:dienelactone hydrolase
MIVTKDIEYEADGRVMIGRMALPEGNGRRPAVLIAHEGPGLDDHQRDRVSRFAEMGFVAFALDYRGGGEVTLDPEVVMARLVELGTDRGRLREVGARGLQVLLDEPRADASRVAALGYCFGGTVVLELARSGADLKAVVGFHPGLQDPQPEASRSIRGKVLMCIGSEDPLIPLAQRTAFEEEMRSAGVDWQMNIYGGAVHSFTHSWADLAGQPHLRFDEQVDRRSWQAMLDLLHEVFD